jgi:hypothetical protein
MASDTKFLNVPVDERLKRELKAHVAAKGITLTAWLDGVLRETFLQQRPHIHVVKPDLGEK